MSNTPITLDELAAMSGLSMLAPYKQIGAPVILNRRQKQLIEKIFGAVADFNGQTVRVREIMDALKPFSLEDTHAMHARDDGYMHYAGNTLFSFPAYVRPQALLFESIDALWRYTPNGSVKDRAFTTAFLMRAEHDMIFFGLGVPNSANKRTWVYYASARLTPTSQSQSQ